MARCGTAFHSEVGKFRFLNEMIKLVSPKYLAAQTPPVVRQKVLQLLYVWTLDYPKETKIKEAYDMLRKQGVIRETPCLSVSADGVGVAGRKPQGASVFQVWFCGHNLKESVGKQYVLCHLFDIQRW